MGRPGAVPPRVGRLHNTDNITESGGNVNPAVLEWLDFHFAGEEALVGRAF